MDANRIKTGILGGLAGGLVFGAMMGAIGMLPMIGKMVGYPSALVGFAVHMVLSSIIGISFAMVLGGAVQGIVDGIGWGVAYGGLWWVLGPLTLMPLFMGMGLGVNWNATAAAAMLPSLMGHLIFGAVLGLTYGRAVQRELLDAASA